MYRERVEALQVAPTERLHQTKPLMQRFQVLSMVSSHPLFPDSVAIKTESPTLCGAKG